MWVQAEHPASDHLRRTFLNNTDGRIAVLDRGRKFAFLKWATHPLPLALRYLAAKDEAFGAPADRAAACPDQKLGLVRDRELLSPDLSAARRSHPKRPRLTHRNKPRPERV